MWDRGSKGWERGSEGWDLGPQPWDQESQTMGSGSAVSSRDQGSGCITFVGSGKTFGHAFGIKEQKFAYKNGISDEKTYLATTLHLATLLRLFTHIPSSCLVSCYTAEVMPEISFD